jgi:C_GCAxxG_C_C family probable redox protein
MGKHQEKAVDLFYQGYNCSQSTVGPFHQEMQCDFNSLIKMASSFGGGMGKMGEVCGALTGVFMAVGAIKGYDDPKDKQAKEKHYELIQQIAMKFKEENGSILCRELLELIETNPKPTTRPPHKRCEYFVRFAASLIEDELYK